MVIFVDLVALSNGLHGSAKRIGRLCYDGKFRCNFRLYFYVSWYANEKETKA